MKYEVENTAPVDGLEDFRFERVTVDTTFNGIVTHHRWLHAETGEEGTNYRTKKEAADGAKRYRAKQTKRGRKA